MQADSFGQKSRTLPRSGENEKSFGESVKLASIREIVQEVRMNSFCLFVCLFVCLFLSENAFYQA